MRIKKKNVLAVMLFLVLLTGASTMFGIGKTCVFSSVKARLLINGKPVANAKVRREWEWNKPGSDESMTDENGVVMFKAVYESSVTRLLPLETVISQILSVWINGEKKDFWISSKREPEENSEYGGKNIDITCELSNKEKLIEEYGISKILTLCTLNDATKEGKK